MTDHSKAGTSRAKSGAGGHAAFLLTPTAESVPPTGTKPAILDSPSLPGYPDQAEVGMHATRSCRLRPPRS